MTDFFVFVNGEFVPASKASLLINDLSIQRGYGIFDFFKTLNGEPIFLELLMELQKYNDLPDSGIRITLTGGYSTDGFMPATPNLIITQQPLGHIPVPELTKSIKVVSYPHRRQLPDVKTIDYLMAIWLQRYMLERGGEDGFGCVGDASTGYTAWCVNRCGALIRCGRGENLAPWGIICVWPRGRCLFGEGIIVEPRLTAWKENRLSLPIFSAPIIR